MIAVVPASTATIVSGSAGTGKTTLLVERAAAAMLQEPEPVLVSASRAAAARRLRRLVLERLDPATAIAGRDEGLGLPLEELALHVICAAGFASGLALDPVLIDLRTAERVFADVARPLYDLTWEELDAGVDPEIAGLRAPDRFAAAVLRLIRKLRDANISADAFFDVCRRGAAEFYARPPNFAEPALIAGTQREYLDSLLADNHELERQRLRELDLAKVIARLYREYDRALVEQGCLTALDAFVEAERLLRRLPELAARVRARFPHAFIDDAQDLPVSALRFLRALYGESFAGVTFAGDPDQATHVFAGVRPQLVFGLAGEQVRCGRAFRLPPEIARAAEIALARPAAPPRHESPNVRLYRGKTARDEVRFVASAIAALIDAGTEPSSIALIARSLRCTPPFEAALLDRGIDVAHAGEFDLYVRHEVRDALAMLWCAVDPFAHDWVLRALQQPPLGFDDATIALLCGEPPDPQGVLFELPPDERAGPKRWDRRRDLRLGTNLTRGDRDDELCPEARVRLQRFRLARERWNAALARLALPDAVSLIFEESGLRTQGEHESEVRFRRRMTLLDEVGARARRFAERDARRTLEDFLRTVARNVETLPYSDTRREGYAAVTIGDVDALKGEEFEHVFVVDVRAGAFAPYYVPDAFLFSPKHGMIPKDNVGDAQASRTAKFTWYQHIANVRENFGIEGRRALACAITRACRSVTITASGKPTRGRAAPELLSELQSRGAGMDESERTMRPPF